ncbi:MULTISPECIES: hypothetical protein [unclassified Methanoculleus]|uniref:hypothetical protein n=1 Tax=unclassified Methanoculleus TaxID=2619537 RepID=UPI0025E4A230|nr:MULTISPECIES: hypothetical protein [unclassified Methanoculleus]
MSTVRCEEPEFEKTEGLRCATVRSAMVRKNRSVSTEGAKNQSMRRAEVFEWGRSSQKDLRTFGIP